MKKKNKKEKKEVRAQVAKLIKSAAKEEPCTTSDDFEDGVDEVEAAEPKPSVNTDDWADGIDVPDHPTKPRVFRGGK